MNAFRSLTSSLSILLHFVRRFPKGTGFIQSCYFCVLVLTLSVIAFKFLGQVQANLTDKYLNGITFIGS